MNNIINQTTEVKDGVVVLTQQTEQRLSRAQLIEQIMMCRRRKDDLVNQSKAIKNRYDAECLAEAEFQKMLDMIPEESPETL